MLVKLSPKKEREYRKAIKALEGNRRHDYLDILENLYREQHHGCDDNTCSMEKAFVSGYSLMAIEQFASSGAPSDEFYKFYSKLPKRTLKAAVDYEVECFRKDEDCESIDCIHCGSPIYNFKWMGTEICCDSCGKSFI